MAAANQKFFPSECSCFRPQWPLPPNRLLSPETFLEANVLVADANREAEATGNCYQKIFCRNFCLPPQEEMKTNGKIFIKKKFSTFIFKLTSNLKINLEQIFKILHQNCVLYD